ncbi:MAG: polysaccharide deacetylase [uncultured bacterium]|nr:MAG: polysaccharide deacetylase [uncultured bacterium]
MIVGLMLIMVFFGYIGKAFFTYTKPVPEEIVPEAVPTASPSATPTPSPTPRPLTFSEMNKLYGPCTNLPVLMYHHVESSESASLYKRTGLNVPPETFKEQMAYLKEKGYTTVSPTDLIEFFDSGKALPAKPVMITFDDGYVDIGDEAFPIMREMEIKATIYIPTGLMENFGYLTWAKIDEMKSSGLITFGNHTWSHKNVGASRDAVMYEISTADGQLAEKGLGEPKTFVYPYGIDTTFAEKILIESGYKLAFTTVRGRIMCEKQRLSLPRIRIGSAPLSVFGL